MYDSSRLTVVLSLQSIDPVTLQAAESAGRLPEITLLVYVKLDTVRHTPHLCNNKGTTMQGRNG
jgi:hypothetical protein